MLAQHRAKVVLAQHDWIGLAIGRQQGWPSWIALFSCFDIGGRRVRVAATAIAALGIAGYVYFDRAVPIHQTPGIVIHFVVAMVVGELAAARSSRGRAAPASWS